jgi:hypothetical protein
VQNFKSIGKYQNTFQGGDTRHFPNLDILLVEPVLYLDPISKFPETTKRPGYFVGIENNVGDTLTFKILKNLDTL